MTNKIKIELTEDEFNNLVDKKEVKGRDIVILQLKDKILSMCGRKCHVDMHEIPYTGYCKDDCPLFRTRNANLGKYADKMCKYPGREIF